MRLILIGLIYAGGTAFAWRSVAFAISLFLWTDIFQPLSFAKMAGAYPVAWYVLFVLLASVTINFLAGRLTFRLGSFFYAICGMILWLLVATIMSPFKEPAQVEFIRYLKYLLPLVLIYCSLQNTRQVEGVAAVLTGSVAIWAAQAGAHCIVHGTNIDLAIHGGQMTERNDFTAAIVGTLPLLAFFATSYQGRFKKMVRMGIWATAALSLAAIFFSLSRGASLGVATMMIFYIGLVSRKKFRDLAITVLGGGLLLLVLPSEWYDRMDTIQVGAEQTEGSAAQRMMLMQGALRATLDNPVFGLGPDGWLQVVHVYGDGVHNPHSIYLKLSSETGITGLVIYLAVIGMTFGRCVRGRRLALKNGDKRAWTFITAFMTCITGLLAAMTFLNYPFNEFLWAWICLANSFVTLYTLEIAKQGSKAGSRTPKRRVRRPILRRPVVPPATESPPGAPAPG